MYFKLALRNVRRQISGYIIYFITVTLTIGLAFAVNNMTFSDLMDALVESFNADFIQPLLILLTCVLCVIMAFVLGYATQFLLRKRKKEFGLYLVMGMARSNIMGIFSCEIIVTFVISLVVGILLGMGIYQAMMAVFSGFIGYSYTPSGYSYQGLLWTIVQVVVIFALASVLSLTYLRVARISSLLQGTETTSKGVNFPVLWAVLFVAAVVVLVIACVNLVDWFQLADYFNHVDSLTIAVIMLLVSLFFVSMSFVKLLFWLLLKRKPCSSRGVRSFTVRQVSARLNTNAAMIGALSLLLAIAVVGPNIFLTMNSMIDSNVNSSYLYDISLQSYNGSSSFSSQLEIIEEYADLESYCRYDLYTVNVTEDEASVNAFCMKESSFKELCSMSGYQGPDLNGGYLICSQPLSGGDGQWFAYTPAAGDDGCIGSLVCPAYFITGGIYDETWYVVPDDVLNYSKDDFPDSAAAGSSIAFQVAYSYLSVYVAEYTGDVMELRAVLYNSRGYGYNLNIKEYERLYEVGQVGLFLLAILSLSAVFLLMSVAVLALKVSTIATEDRENYRVMWKLGATNGQLRGSLFLQMFLLFFMPFIVPLLLNIPLYCALNFVFITSTAGSLTAASIAGQLAAVSGIMVGVFALYLVISFVIVWLDIKRHLRTETRN